MAQTLGARRSVGGVAFDLANTLLMALFAFTILVPFWIMLVLSFTPNEWANDLGLKLWTARWSFATYRFSLSSYGDVVLAYGNSIFRTVAGTAAIVVATVAAAYPLSKKRLPGRTFMTVVILITLFFSGGFITLYLVVRGVGLLNSRWALILPSMANGFYILIMRNFLMTIDDAYEEAAFIDGANYLQILTRVMLPLSKPVLAVIALWAAVFHWNEWFHALLFLNDESKLVLQLILRRMMFLLTSDDLFDMLDWADQQGIILPTKAVRAAVMLHDHRPDRAGLPVPAALLRQGDFRRRAQGLVWETIPARCRRWRRTAPNTSQGGTNETSTIHDLRRSVAAGADGPVGRRPGRGRGRRHRDDVDESVRRLLRLQGHAGTLRRDGHQQRDLRERR